MEGLRDLTYKLIYELVNISWPLIASRLEFPTCPPRQLIN